MECGPVHFQLSLSIVAISAVAGPVTFAQSDRFVPASFCLAISNVFSFSEIGNHPSQKERAKYLIGPECASNAGSAVPVVPSSVAQTRSMFSPPALAALAVAAVDLTACSVEQLMPFF